MMFRTWNCLSQDLQLTVSRQAMLIAAESTAHQADMLADEFESGCLPDRGGSEALRLLAALLRTQANAGIETAAACAH
jgi:hypothetical protein